MSLDPKETDGTFNENIRNSAIEHEIRRMAKLGYHMPDILGKVSHQFSVPLAKVQKILQGIYVK